MSSRIAVPQELIDNAIRGNSGHCMFAEAIRAEYPDAKRISVDLATMRYTRKDKRYVHLTPRRAQEMLVAFDQGATMAPFSFQLQQPVQVVQARAARTDLAASVVRNTRGQVPRKRGGATPPRGALTDGDGGGRVAGRTRAYGLRALSR